jgi:hypothetical protein
MYTFHFYAASHNHLYTRIESYINTIPIFVSEWGISAADGGGSYNTVVAQNFLDLFSSIDSTILSWTMWNWSDKDETSAILESPSSCSSESWTAVTCPSRFAENYFKSEDYSLMVACNNSGYIPLAIEESSTPFVEEYQWLFWTLGAFVLLLIVAFCVYTKYKQDSASFHAVPKEGAQFVYVKNPYGGGRDPKNPSQQSPPGSPSRPVKVPRVPSVPKAIPGQQSQQQQQQQRSPPRQRPQQQEVQMQMQQQQQQQQPQSKSKSKPGRKSPPRPRPGQRRPQPTTSNSRKAAEIQVTATQLQSRR